ncbi:homocysteine S-methyltransferase family protein [bacterium]|nr:homocysteine S-methyltransferase family protein [bacterium]
MIDLNKKLQGGILISDGAIGTMLQKFGMPAGVPSEAWNLTHPEKLREIHKLYYDAGARFIATNTFCGNLLKLRSAGLESEFKKVNSIAVELVRSSVGSDAIIAGSIGPLGVFLHPFGELTFVEALNQFKNQAKVLAEAGADVITLETFTDLREIKAAIFGVAEATKIPIVAQMSFDEGTRTVTGTSAEVFSVTVSALGVAAVGANCVNDPDNMVQIISKIRRYTDKPVICQPNGGIPELENGRTIFPATPDEMAEYSLRYWKAGANIIGSCCGSTPEHTQGIAKAVRGKQPESYQKEKGTFITSRTRLVAIGTAHPFVPVGERINPTGRIKLSEELQNFKFSIVRYEASIQERAGALALDVNTGIGGEREADVMGAAIRVLQNVTNLPLFIDSPNIFTLEKGIELYVGRPIINSVSGTEKDLKNILPLAKRQGAAFIGLTMDESGIPKKADKRLKIAEKIINSAVEIGLKQEDVIIDPVIMPLSTPGYDPKIAFETLRLLKKELDIATIVGLSNISYGMPKREQVNITYLSMAISAGLDAAILNPLDRGIFDVINAGKVLTNPEKYTQTFIEEYSKAQIEDEDIERETTLENEIRLGNRNGVIGKITEALKNGIKPTDIIDTMLIPSMKAVGDLFEKKELFLLQLVSSAEALKAGLDFLKPELIKGKERASKGKFVIATVEGDIHDIGKNLVRTMFEAYGYDVFDLGKNVTAEVILEACKMYKPDILGLSALMTTTMVEMKNVIDLIRENGLNMEIIVGGACVTKAFSNEIGADAYASSAIEGVKIAEELLSKK